MTLLYRPANLAWIVDVCAACAGGMNGGCTPGV